MTTAIQQTSTPQTGRGRPRSEKTQDAIIEATLDILAEDGPLGLSIEGVAARSGVAKSSIYRRWSDKTALITDAVLHMKGPLPTPPGKTVREDLIYLLKATMRDKKDPRKTAIMPKMFSLVHQCDDQAECTYHAMLDTIRERIIKPRRALTISVLQRGVEQGGIRPDLNLELLCDMLSAPVVVCGLQHARLYTNAELESLVDVVLKGVKPQWGFTNDL